MWQSRPVFISSTFADMQAERDHLRNYVFPELEERAKSRRRHLGWVDLRLGVATPRQQDADARELQILKVCLAEVRRCRPFLIVLLGDRYGWVPPAATVARYAAEEGFVADVVGRSVTDLEIRFGVLANPDQQTRSFFYFREPLPYRDMPAQVAAIYSDAHARGSHASDHATKLAALKREIGQVLPDRVRSYTAAWDKKRRTVTGLEAWGQRVLEDIWSEIVASTPPGEAEISWQATERAALEDYIEDRSYGFVGREATLGRFISIATSPAKEGAMLGACLTGQPGAGKSAIFGEMKRRLTRMGTLVLAHAAAASVRSPSVDDMLRRWIEELGIALGVDPGLQERADPDRIDSTFHSLLARMAVQRRVVVLIDALDQFEATIRARHLTWLPRPWPTNARLIATAIPGDATRTLQAHDGIEVLPLPPLDTNEARAIVEGICKRYGRTLWPEVLEALLAKPGPSGTAAGNTLWLTVAAEELNLVDSDDFSLAKRAYNGTAEEQMRALMLDKLAELPAEVPGLYATAFNHAEALFGRDITNAFLGAIAVSRAGWRETDFRALLPKLSRPANKSRLGGLARLFRSSTPRPDAESWNELQFASLRRLFRGQIRQRGAVGQWDFNHAQMRVAVRRRLATQRVSEAEFHSQIATHLLSLPDDDPMLESEAMVHLLGSEDWARAADFYRGDARPMWQYDGATRVLADAVLIKRNTDGRSGLDQVLRLLDAATEPTGIMLHLHESISDRAQLTDQARIYNAACKTAERLARADPGNSQRQRNLSVSYDMIGDVLAEQGNLPAALESYRASLAIKEAHADPEISNRRDLIMSYDKIGNVLFAQNNPAAALESYRASLAIIERLAQTEPQIANWQSDLSVSYDRIGAIFFASGQLRTALESYRAALAIRERLVQSMPESDNWRHRLVEVLPAIANWQRDLSVSNINVGDVQMAQGELAGALKSYRASFAITERLAQADPGNFNWQECHGVSYARIGDVQVAQGELAGALKSYRASFAISERLAQADPGNAGWQRHYSVSHLKLATVFTKSGEIAKALDRLHEGRAISARLAALSPSNALWNRDLALFDREIARLSEP